VIGPAWRRLARGRPTIACLLIGLVLTLPMPGRAAAGLALVRDAEIEEMLTSVATPILEAAGMAPTDVRFFIVNDPQLNAFVAGGSNLFINTGLLMRTEHVGQLAGVIAHEIGHIAGGHLSRVGTAQNRAAVEVIAATVLGAAAAVAGAPALGTAIITGGQTLAQGDFLSFTRSQEQSADQAALTYLERAAIPADGLAEFFRILDQQNLLSASRVSPFLQSHPLTRDRITFVDDRVRRAHEGGDGGPKLPLEWEVAHRRMVAKLGAFLEDPGKSLQQYQGDSLEARYARSIAYYRQPDIDRAVAEIDGLIADYPADPYFHELKGQMLFENGRVAAAVAPYREAAELDSHPLIQIGLARALIETGDADDTAAAVGYLETAVRGEPTSADAWRLLGIARGRAGAIGASSVALAEWALLVGKPEDAELHARRAEGHIRKGDPEWLHLQDVRRAIEEERRS
jgi:predicted Zn-dependent protease